MPEPDAGDANDNMQPLPVADTSADAAVQTAPDSDLGAEADQSANTAHVAEADAQPGSFLPNVCTPVFLTGSALLCS